MLFSGEAFRISSSTVFPSAVASGSDDKTIRLWDLATRTRTATLTGHTDWVRSVAFSPDGKTLASGSADNTIRLWKVANRT